MTATQTHNYIKICMNTWLLCEACIHSEEKKMFPEEKLVRACRDCSESCLSVVSLIISNPEEVQKKVFECFLYCRECYHECVSSNDSDIQYCGEVCDHCADKMKELMQFHYN